MISELWRWFSLSIMTAALSACTFEAGDTEAFAGEGDVEQAQQGVESSAWVYVKTIGDGTKVASRSTTLWIQGMYSQASTDLSVQAYNPTTALWTTLTTARSASISGGNTLEGHAQFFWSTSHLFSVPNTYWSAGSKSGYFTRLRVRVGTTNLRAVTQNTDGCFDRTPTSENWLEKHECFSRVAGAYAQEFKVYTHDYSRWSSSCAEAFGGLNHGHFEYKDMPQCALNNVYDLIAGHTRRSLIDEHYEIKHHGAADAERMDPITDGDMVYELGGFFGGHRRYLERMRHRLSTSGYSWLPNGEMPGWRPKGQPIAGKFLNPVVAPGGAANNCLSHEKHGTPIPTCPTGWKSDPVGDPTPDVSTPTSLLFQNICNIATATELFAEVETKGFHPGVHESTGGAFQTFDSPSNPLFFLWHNYVDDIWTDWQNCD